MTHTPDSRQFALNSGHIANFNVSIHDDTVIVLQEDGRQVCKKRIPSRGPALGSLAIRHLTYWETPDFRLIGLVTEVGEDYFFGFALNLDDPMMSEWGYFPSFVFIEFNQDRGDVRRTGV